MTDIWDEKPEEVDSLDRPRIIDFWISIYEKSKIDAWLEKWKPIINEWQEKAEKWDVLNNTPYRFDVEIGKPSRYLRQEIQIHSKATKKLEAIKKWYDENEDCIDPDYGDEHAKARVSLRKILEGVG